MNKLEKKLSTNEIASSKQAASLKGRATNLSTSLTNKKEKGMLLKKCLQDNLSSLQDDIKGAIKEKESEVRDMAILHKLDKDKAVERERGREQSRNWADTLRQQLKAHVESANDNGERKLLRSQKPSSVARERLKVSVLVPLHHFYVCTYPLIH